MDRYPLEYYSICKPGIYGLLGQRIGAVNLILGPISSNPWIPDVSDLANGTDKWYQLQSKSGKFLTQPTATQPKLDELKTFKRLLSSAIPAMVGALKANMVHIIWSISYGAFECQKGRNFGIKALMIKLI